MGNGLGPNLRCNTVIPSKGQSTDELFRGFLIFVLYSCSGNLLPGVEILKVIVFEVVEDEFFGLRGRDILRSRLIH